VLKRLRVIIAGAAVALAIAQWMKPRAEPRLEPAPRWRNGVIVDIRHCEAPSDSETELRCAALFCAQRVTVLLTNPQQATLTLEHYARAGDGSIVVRGALDQYLRAPTLPTGFTCVMRDFRDARPEFSFARRDAVVRRAQRGS
jgi:hypothetical protein